MNHIVYADLRDFVPHFDALYHSSSKERRARADLCQKREDALRCLVSGTLLSYAARRSGIPEYTVTENPWGKPVLEGKPDFHFNLSHSGHYAAIAWGSEPVGIDLELLRQRDSIPKLVKRHFTPAEQAYAEDMRRFYETWTAKESWLKFQGTGIDRPLSSFCTRNPALMSLLHTFFPEKDCCLTVCTQGPCPEPLRVSPDILLK